MDDDKNSEQKIPPYVCCVLTEETWTWFAAILFFVILLLVATLKYCRKYFSKPKFETKNLTLLRRTLIEDDGDALGKIWKRERMSCEKLTTIFQCYQPVFSDNYLPKYWVDMNSNLRVTTTFFFIILN